MPIPIFPVILAGGASSRLWPLSDRRRPKWDLRLFGEHTLLEGAWHRARELAPVARCLVVAGKDHVPLIRRSCKGLPARNLLVEPEGRDTSAAIAYAAGRILQLDPHGVMLVMPGDHVIAPDGRFARCAHAAATASQREKALVTFGILPRFACTAYGYIHRAEKLTHSSGHGEPEVYGVHSFKEKPDRYTAEAYVKSGEYYWNGGIFAFPLPVLMENLESHLPGHAAMARELAEARRPAAWNRTARKHFPDLRKISIDFGIMEKAAKVVTVAADFDWDDIGSWSAVGDHLPKVESNSVGPGTKLDAIGAQNNVVVGSARRIALIGVEGLAVIDDPAGLLVCRLEKDQSVKEIAQRAAAEAAKAPPKRTAVRRKAPKRKPAKKPTRKKAAKPSARRKPARRRAGKP